MFTRLLAWSKFDGVNIEESDRGTFWNLNVPTAVVAGDGAMLALSVYQHLSVKQMETLFSIQKEMKGLLIVPISVSVWQTEQCRPIHKRR